MNGKKVKKTEIYGLVQHRVPPQQAQQSAC